MVLALENDHRLDLHPWQQIAEIFFPIRRRHRLPSLETVEEVGWIAFVLLGFVRDGKYPMTVDMGADLSHAFVRARQIRRY